jgi:uncharacterized protein (DUF302 family)
MKAETVPNTPDDTVGSTAPLTLLVYQEDGTVTARFTYNRNVTFCVELPSSDAAAFARMLLNAASAAE